MADKTPPAEAAAPIPAPGIRPGETFETVLAAASLTRPLVEGKDGALHVLMPKGFALQALPDATTKSPWPKARLTVDDRQSLIDYANRYSLAGHSVLIADFDAGAITARLDWHPDNDAENTDFGTAGADAHSVTLLLRLSEEFARWNAIEGTMLPQEDFALFLEENAVDISEPAATTMIEISRDFQATVGQTYDSAIRLDNGDRRLSFKNETNVTSGIIIPQKFVLNIPIYNGEEPDELTALFRWRPNGKGSVNLGFAWHRVEYQRRAHFQQIAFAAAEQTGLPVFMGRKAA